MNALAILMERLNLVRGFRELGGSKERKETLFALAFAQLLVQLTFLPVTLTIPSVANHFGVDVDDASWSVIMRLLALGATVFLAARLGEKFGYVRMFFLGIVVMTLASLLAATSQTLIQLIMWSGLGGFGGALVTANSNAIITLVFEPNERGQAFSVPVTGSRIGTLVGLGLFGLFLEFLSWRLVFVTSMAVGVLSIGFAYTLIKYQAQQSIEQRRNTSIDYFGAALLIAVLVAFILSGSHIHEGTESFTSPEALSYHIPMNILTVALVSLFLVLQSRTREPFLDFRYFKRKYFSMALFSHSTFHLSMLTIFTLVPIVVEDGLGYGPIVATMILLPHQSLGLFIPPIAGWIYDRYSPRWMGPLSLFMVALGVALLGIFAAAVPIWGIPLLLLPASIGTSMFIAPYNALVMNTLPENRSFASGMLETTRQMGHTVGSTIAATILGLSLPAAIELMTSTEAQSYYQQGVQIAALSVVWIIVAGGVVALFQRVPDLRGQPASEVVAAATGND
ncbi:MAG: MFS transporter [Dehalococcoidia bacterium]